MTGAPEGFPGYKPVPPGWFKICVGFITGTPKGSPKVVFMEKPGIEPATPGLQGIALIHYTTAASLLFCGFPGYKPVPPGWFKLCWFYNGNTQRLTESGFMEKPGIEPATPGLQGIALIHYTTAASLLKKNNFLWLSWV